jgi:hypothetical protein
MGISCKPNKNVRLCNNSGTFEVYLLGERICATVQGNVAARIYIDLVEWMDKNESLFI